VTSGTPIPPPAFRMECVALQVPKYVPGGTRSPLTRTAAGPGRHHAELPHREHHLPRDRDAHSAGATPICHAAELSPV